MGASPRDRPAPPPSRPAALVRVTIDDEQVVYDPVRQRTHRLNPTAALVLDRCDGRSSLESISSELAATFDAPADEVRIQVDRVVADFAREGLIEPTDDRPSHAAVEPPPPDRAWPRPAEDGGTARTGPLPRFVTSERRALDLRVRIATDDAELAERVEQLFGALVEAEPATGSSAPATGDESVRLYELVEVSTGTEVRLDGETVGRARTATSALSLLQWHLNQQTAAASSRRLLLHAAAARLDHGDLVLLPAPPNGGKSTLIAGLTRDGLDYLTDETVAVDPVTLECEGYRKPINLDRGAWALFGVDAPDGDDPAGPAERLVDPRSLRAGALTGSTVGRAGLLAFPTYDPSAPTRVEPMRRATVLVALITNCLNLADHGDGGVEALGRLAAEVPGIELSMADLPSAVAAVRYWSRP
jgi:hypothetical protein